MVRTDLDIKGQSTPVRSVPGHPFSSYLGLTQGLSEILAGGLYSHQTLKSVTAAPQDEMS